MANEGESARSGEVDATKEISRERSQQNKKTETNRHPREVCVDGRSVRMPITSLHRDEVPFKTLLPTLQINRGRGQARLTMPGTIFPSDAILGGVCA